MLTSSPERAMCGYKLLLYRPPHHSAPSLMLFVNLFTRRLSEFVLCLLLVIHWFIDA